MVDWITIAISIGGSLIASMLLVEYRLRRERSVEECVELEQWYADCAGYAAEVRRIWQRLYDSADQPGTNLSEIRSEMSLLEGQISRHASKGEQKGANEGVISALDELASECRQTSEHQIHINSLPEFQEFRDDIIAAVEDVEDILDER